MRVLTKSPQHILKSVFGYDAFRPLQDECIRDVLKKKDNLLVMPTGGGKSLCYQIPGLIFDGLTIVVSPLIALMQDQVSQLKALGVDAVMLNSSLTWDEYDRNKALVLSGQTKLLYLAPETLVKDDIQHMLCEISVDCIAIDEAHCISEWGHDFRPEYRQLKSLRKNFPDAVYLAMTATATPRVRLDIVSNLGLQVKEPLIASFNRENLYYEVIPKSSPSLQTLDFLKRFKHQSGIIYCFSRKQVDALTAELNQHGYKALSYHAGLPDDVRSRNQEMFIRDDVQIMVATIAFGMGINKPNVRFVIHFDLPKNLESYYQETGRAGRDNLPAHCLLLFGYGDIRKIRYFIDQKESDDEKRVSQTQLNAMIHYAEAEACRRTPLMNYFGETYTRKTCGQCDNCLNPKEVNFDLTEAAKKFLETVLKTGERFGASHVIDVIRGSRSQKVLSYFHEQLDVHGIGREYSAKQWQFLVRQFIQRQLLYKEPEYGVLKLNANSNKVLKNELEAQGYAPPAEKEKVVSRVKKELVIEDYDAVLFDILRKKRKQLADSQGIPPYIIFPDKSLIEMSATLPQNKDSFSTIFGVGQKKLEDYGDAFLGIIQAYSQARHK